MEASVRLQNELKNFLKNKPFGWYATPNPLNILEWKCQFQHRGFFFSLTLNFPKNYPISPPKIKFNEKVYHPNIFSDNSVCLDIISQRWSPSFTIKDILIGLKQLFDFPNPSSPANQAAAQKFKSEKKNYEAEVEKNNIKHHKTYKIPFFK